MRGILALAAVFLLVLVACVKGTPHMYAHHVGERAAASPGEPPIEITINPEARVSVTPRGVLPPPVPCGSAADLRVKVVNRGFVTAPLEAAFVGYVPHGATLALPSEPLKGEPEELRTLHITLTEPGAIDLTISFKLRNDVFDLGGRDRVHFLLRCLEAR